MPDVIRDPTNEELRDFIPLMTSKETRVKRPEDVFTEKLSEQERLVSEANKKLVFEKRVPFARQVAKLEAKDAVDSVTKSYQRKGFLDDQDRERLKVDWSRYSDRANFEFVKEWEEADNSLSRRNPGVSVSLRSREYKFKG